MARQLTLDLPVTPGLGAEDFLVGASNEHAFRTIESWPDWPGGLLLLVGPAGSGKTHLASIWAGQAGADIVAADAVEADRVPGLSRRPALAIDGLQGGIGDEQALFHLVNLAREHGHFLLVTSDRPVSALWIRTPDLLSRLRRAPTTELLAPDDALLRSVLVKLFHDRQLLVDSHVVDYVAARVERSLAAASRVVALLDREALSRGRRVTRPIAAAILADDDLGQDDSNGEAPPRRHPPVATES